MTFEKQVESILKDIKDLLVSKNISYGNAALEPIRIFSKGNSTEQLLVRIDDKLNRIKNDQNFGNEDTINDLIGYLILLKIKEISV